MDKRTMIDIWTNEDCGFSILIVNSWDLKRMAWHMNCNGYST